MKDETVRPKYNKLLEQPFIQRWSGERVNTAEYVTATLDRMQGNEPRNNTESMLEKMEITEKT